MASTIHRRSAAIRQSFDLGRQQTRDRAALQSREWPGGHGRGLPIPTLRSSCSGSRSANGLAFARKPAGNVPPGLESEAVRCSTCAVRSAASRCPSSWCRFRSPRRRQTNRCAGSSSMTTAQPGGAAFARPRSIPAEDAWAPPLGLKFQFPASRRARRAAPGAFRLTSLQ
jgi:hypothetical protein